MTNLISLKAKAAKFSGIRYRVKTEDYTGNNGNFWFSAVEMRSTSYRWYDLFRVIGGKNVINACTYSNQTAKHLGKLRTLLSHHGIEVDLAIYAPKGLNDLESALNWYQAQVSSLNTLIMMPGTRKAKNEERAKQVQEHLEMIKVIKRLMKSQQRKLDRKFA